MACEKLPFNLKAEKLLNQLLLMFIFLIPSNGIELQDYELVVGHGSKLLMLNVHLNQSANVPVANWSKDAKGKILTIVPDLARNTIIFSSQTKNASSISVFNPESNTTRQIYSSPRGSIESLQLLGNYLYWCNESTKSVMRLSITDHVLITPQLVFKDFNATFESCTIHPTTGVIYYTEWRRGNESQIHSYDPKERKLSVLVKNVYQPKSLYIDASTNELYWIDNPPGIYFNIEKISLNDSQEREMILKGQNQHPFAISVICSRIYWTDLMNKILWEFQLESKTNRPVQNFKTDPPYGISLAKSVDPLNCVKEPKIAQDVQSTTNIPKINATMQCLGENCAKFRDISAAAEKVELKYPLLALCNYHEKSNCLNGASCIIFNTQTHCLCTQGFLGANCEIVNEEKQNEDAVMSSAYRSPLFISWFIFFLFTVSLLVVIALLTRKIKKQNSKPKIRRRVVVSHRSSELDNSSSVCEMIDIENCCNMNICETPCYERLGSFGPASSSRPEGLIGRARNSSGKEDKKCLLNF